MEGFLTFIIFLVIGFYVLGFIIKIALKLYLKRVQKRFGDFADAQNSQQSYGSYTYGNSQSKNHAEGDVYITQISEPKEKRFKKETGDYIDFEEVK